MMPSRPRMGDQHDVKNPLHTTFHNPSIPPNTITQDNVLDYFCNQNSPFYDSECNNQAIKMQSIATPLKECLEKMVGIQYDLWSAQPPLFVICKQRRNSPSQVTPLAYYYIVNGVIYQAPDLYSYAQSGLLGTIDPLRKAFEETMLYSRYNVAKGYYWEFKDKPSSSNEKDKKPEKEKPQQARSTHFQNNRTDQLMKLLFEQFPPSSALEIVAKPEEEPQDDGNKMEVDEDKNGPRRQQVKRNQMQPPASRQV